MTATPARLGPGEMLAALGQEVDPGRAAGVYAACGLPVVPLHTPRPGGGCSCPGPGCPDPGKHPRVRGGVHAAATDPAQVAGWWRRWPAANLGLACGVAFDVCDVDGGQGVEALRAVFQAGGAPAPGPLARTGGGGWHLLFAPTGLGNRVRFGPGLDWRGRGGLIVAPPSQHASGRRYRWVRPLAGELPRVPAGLAGLLVPPRPAPASPARARRAGYGAAALAGEAAKVRVCAPGSGLRQKTLNVAALKLGRHVAAGLLDEAEVWATLTAAAAATGLSPAEIAKTIRRGLADGHAQAGPHPPWGRR
jgi:hypothetical protein